MPEPVPRRWRTALLDTSRRQCKVTAEHAPQLPHEVTGVSAQLCFGHPASGRQNCTMLHVALADLRLLPKPHSARSGPIHIEQTHPAKDRNNRCPLQLRCSVTRLTVASGDSYTRSMLESSSLHIHIGVGTLQGLDRLSQPMASGPLFYLHAWHWQAAMASGGSMLSWRHAGDHNDQRLQSCNLTHVFTAFHKRRPPCYIVVREEIVRIERLPVSAMQLTMPAHIELVQADNQKPMLRTSCPVPGHEVNCENLFLQAQDWSTRKATDKKSGRSLFVRFLVDVVRVLDITRPLHCRVRCGPELVHLAPKCRAPTKWRWGSKPNLWRSLTTWGHAES